MKKILLSCLILLLRSFLLTAQDMIVVGQIFDKKEKTPIPSANIWIKGTQIGTTSNNEGFFLLRLPEIKAHTLTISVVGYKRKEVELENKQDQWTNIFLDQERVLLDEVIVFPGENPAHSILRKVRERKAWNNPDQKVGFESEITENENFYFFNIKRKSLQRKLFRNITEGMLENSDSNLILPVYHKREQKKQTVSENGEVSTVLLKTQANALEAVGKESFEALMENYVSAINFYKNNIILLGKNFVSPLANFGNVYYKYYLTDSVKMNDSKHYIIRFYPKNDKELAFRGEMSIDSLTSALVNIKAQLPASANINFVNNIALQQSFSELDSSFYYSEKSEGLSFRFNLLETKNKKGVAAMIHRNSTFQNQTLSQKKEFSTNELIHNTDSADSLSVQEQQTIDAIDRLNKTKLQKIANELVNIALHGYVRAWKFDIGPLVNTYKYNKLEGHRIAFGMRTGEAMIKNSTIGGFFGYGFGDKQWKYGAEFQSRFGKQKAHTIGAFFSDNAEQYGAEKYRITNENFVGDANNLFSCISIYFYGDLARKRKAELAYKYEERNFNLSLRLKHEQLFGNRFVPLEQNKKKIPMITNSTVTVTSRIGFKQRYIDGFFHRYYLYNELPVIHLQAEYGHYNVAQKQGDYFQLLLYLRHKFPLWGGNFTYRIQAGHTIGQVPWTLLDITKGNSGISISETQFGLMQPMEFVSDSYIYTGFTYFTKGLLFNWIPGIKKLNLREVVSFQMAYGGILNPNHASVLDFPVHFAAKNLNIPYMETSIGIANILKFFTVESVWRITHRENRKANWGIRVRFNLDF